MAAGHNLQFLAGDLGCTLCPSDSLGARRKSIGLNAIGKTDGTTSLSHAVRRLTPHAPKLVRGGDHELVVLRIAAGSPPPMSTAWCGAVQGAGSPIVTTSDGRSDPIVWILGAEGDNLLHGFRGDTGEPLFTSALALAGIHHFQTLIAAGGRLYVGADGRVYAFTF
jgi:hypothetical protein